MKEILVIYHSRANKKGECFITNASTVPISNTNQSATFEILTPSQVNLCTPRENAPSNFQDIVLISIRLTRQEQPYFRC